MVEVGQRTSRRVSVEKRYNELKAVLKSGSVHAPLGLQFIAAIVLLIAMTTYGPCTAPELLRSLLGCPNYEYGIAVAVIAMVFSSIALGLTFKREWYDKKLFTVPEIGSIPSAGAVSVGYLISIFLFVWWIIGTSVLTFQGPFIVTGNGFFAAWCEPSPHDPRGIQCESTRATFGWRLMIARLPAPRAHASAVHTRTRVRRESCRAASLASAGLAPSRVWWRSA